MNKRASEVISIYWFLFLLVVAFVIVYIVSMFYGTPYDVRMIEAKAMGNQIADCLTSQGYFNDSALNQSFSSNFSQNCHLNFTTENVYDWGNTTQYYAEVNIYKYNPTQFNLLGSRVANMSLGNINLKLAWQLSQIPQNHKSSFLPSFITSTVSPQRKVDKIVIHTTDGPNAQSAIQTISSEGLSVHYMITRDGEVISSNNENQFDSSVYQNAFVPETELASHAGCTFGTQVVKQCTSGCINSNGLLDPNCYSSELGGTYFGTDGGVSLSDPGCCLHDFNVGSIGIELVNLGPQCSLAIDKSSIYCQNSVSAYGIQWENFSQAQIDSLASLVANIATRYNIPIDRQHIIGHYQITTYKTDPGPDFPWSELITKAKQDQANPALKTASSGSNNFPQGQEKSFYAVDKKGNQYVVQILTIVRKTEKNVAQ